MFPREWVASFYPINDEKVELFFSGGVSCLRWTYDTITNIDAAEEQVVDEVGADEHAIEESLVHEQIADEARVEKNDDDENKVEEDVNKGESPTEVSK